MKNNRNINISNGNYNENIEGNYIQGDYYLSEQNSDISKAVIEIQELLINFKKNNPTATEIQQQEFVSTNMNPTRKK